MDIASANNTYQFVVALKKARCHHLEQKTVIK